MVLEPEKSTTVLLVSDRAFSQEEGLPEPDGRTLVRGAFIMKLLLRFSLIYSFLRERKSLVTQSLPKVPPLKFVYGFHEFSTHER